MAKKEIDPKQPGSEESTDEPLARVTDKKTMDRKLLDRRAMDRRAMDRRSFDRKVH